MARRGLLSGERGAILTAAFFSAFLASIASYLVLQIAVSQARHARFHREHVGARHAAEAGLVWGYERLYNDITWSDPNGDVDLVIDGLNVDVVVPPCGVPPCPRAVQAKVTY